MSDAWLQRETANALTSLYIVVVDVSLFRRHFAASISILTGKNVSTVGEFGTYIL